MKDMISDMSISMHGHSFYWACKPNGCVPLCHYITCWWPSWFKSATVCVLNNATCFVFGHEPMGPFDFSATDHIKKFCPHCGKEWPDDVR